MPEPVTVGVVIWLAKEVVAPDLFTRGVDALRTPAEESRLISVVRKDTGIRPGRGFRKWYRSDDTWRALVERSPTSFDALVGSLADDRVGRVWHRRRSPGEAQRLVESAITNFLVALDPSMAIAISDYRQGRKLDELQATLDADQTFEANLALVPPAARVLLSGSASTAARRLAAVSAADDPGRALAALAAAPPPWLSEASADVLFAGALLTQAHGLHAAAGGLFVLAGDAGHDREEMYTQAAFEYLNAGQGDEARRLLALAEEIEASSWRAAVVRAYMAEDWSALTQAVSEEVVTNDSLMAQVYAAGAQKSGDLTTATRVLERATEAHPHSTSIRLNLARLLLLRGANPASPSRTADRLRALDLARAARDERRALRLSSTEAVQVAMTVCMAMGDFASAYRQGARPPGGEAIADEAADPDVQRMLVQASLALGQVEEASGLASQGIDDGFDGLLLRADTLWLAKATPEAIAAAYAEAWAAAEDDQDKVSLWLAAAQAGVDPLPGVEELGERHDEGADLVRGQIALRAGDAQGAVDRLRQRRDSEVCSRLLVFAYLQLDRPDLARAELERIAARFNTPLLLHEAVQMLLSHERLDEAEEVALRGLEAIPKYFAQQRDLLHRVLAVSAGDRSEWHELESRVRAWIDERGADPSRRWLLVQSIFNQGEMAKAWAVLSDHPSLEPTTPLEAQLWIALNAAQQPTPELPARMRSLIDQFDHDRDVVRVAVNAYFHMGSKIGSLPESEIAAWGPIFSERAANAEEGGDDVFTTIKAPDNPEDLVEALRPLLEPAAERSEAIHDLARKGAPLGLIAASVGRSYTAVLVHRGPGWLPISSTRDDARAHEVEVARQHCGEAVVIDTSAVAVGFFLGEKWPDLLAAFASLEIGGPARREISTEVANLSMRTSGWLSWDADAGLPVIQEATPEDLKRLADHTAWIGAQAELLTVRDVGSLSLPGLEGRNDEGLLAWLGQVELARQRGVALWADDLGLRQIASEFEVPTFGTCALLEVLGQGKPDGWLRAAHESLLDAYCVDLPVVPGWLVRSAAEHQWQGGPAATNLARPMIWTDPRSALAALDGIMTAAADADPVLTGRWLFAALCGICKGFDPATAHAVCSGLVCKAVALTDFDSERFRDFLDAARSACSTFSVPDPTGAVLERLHDYFLEQLGPELGARLYVSLGDQLDDDDREALRDLMWGVKGHPPKEGYS
jgi:lipopolysaccharide biosynthesis regulator YciM